MGIPAQEGYVANAMMVKSPFKFSWVVPDNAAVIGPVKHVGAVVGNVDGTKLGDAVSVARGAFVGAPVGNALGAELGLAEGFPVGT